MGSYWKPTAFKDGMPEIDIDKLPCREVTPEQFRFAAEVEKWQDHVVDLFLKSPIYNREYVKVGFERLRVKTEKQS
jgi:hypothetical protein